MHTCCNSKTVYRVILPISAISVSGSILDWFIAYKRYDDFDI